MNMITASVTILFLAIICDSALYPSGEITNIKEARLLSTQNQKKIFDFTSMAATPTPTQQTEFVPLTEEIKGGYYNSQNMQL